MSPALTFQVSRTAADYDALRRQASRQITARPLYKLLVRTTILAGGVVAFALLYFTKTSSGWGLTGPEALVLFFVFFGAWSLINWLAAPLIQSRFYPALDVFRAPLTVSLSDDGVLLESAAMSQKVRWTALSGVSETPAHVFLQIDGMAAIVLPRRAFADAAQQSEFLRALRAHQPQSQP